MTRPIYWIAGIALWLGLTTWGLAMLNRYSFQPGTSGKPAARDWPAHAAIPLPPDAFTLVVALHPECPCSLATAEEVDTILARTSERLQVIALFVGARSDHTSIESSRLWRRMQRIPGVVLRHDHDGEEARAFDFRTSGETRLYTAKGTLEFRGGITAARGHPGDNPGRATILAAVNERMESSPVTFSPVFGCSLFARTEQKSDP